MEILSFCILFPLSYTVGIRVLRLKGLRTEEKFLKFIPLSDTNLEICHSSPTLLARSPANRNAILQYQLYVSQLIWDLMQLPNSKNRMCKGTDLFM